jgi:hypothetical protein
MMRVLVPVVVGGAVVRTGIYGLGIAGVAVLASDEVTRLQDPTAPTSKDYISNLLMQIFNSAALAQIAEMTGPAAPSRAASEEKKKSDSWNIYFHGTGDVSSVLGGLNPEAAAKQSNGGGQLGFYLATTYDHAYAYADDHYPTGAVLQFSISGTAQAELAAAGAQLRSVMYGRGQEIGREFFIPISAFNVFNAALAAGQIRVVPLPAIH